MTLRDELVARAVALQPLLREHAARTEADRRVPQEVVEAITRGACSGSAPPSLRRPRGRDAHPAGGLRGPGGGRRVHLLGGQPGQRLHLGGRPVPGPGPGRRLRGGSGRPGDRGARPHRHRARGRRRRLAGQRPLVLQLRLLAGDLGRARGPAYRRRRRGRRPGRGPGAARGPPGGGHLVRRGHEGDGEQLPGGVRGLRSGAPGAVGARGGRGRVRHRAEGRAVLPLRLRAGPRAHPGRPPTGPGQGGTGPRAGERRPQARREHGLRDAGRVGRPPAEARRGGAEGRDRAAARGADRRRDRPGRRAGRLPGPGRARPLPRGHRLGGAEHPGGHHHPARRPRRRRLRRDQPPAADLARRQHRGPPRARRPHRRLRGLRQVPARHRRHHHPLV